MRTRERLLKHKWAEYLTAFLLPAAIIFSVLAVFGMYPFGDRSLLVVDMNSEYIDYFAYMHRAVRNGGSFLRSWDMGMGLDMLGLIAFYTASPFNIIMLIMPVSLITEAVFVITVLKIAACGLFFFIYAKNTFQLPWLWVLSFSTAYALIGYNLYYSSNIMWLDGVMFLPLVILGLHRMVNCGKYGLFLASLIYVFYSSYYIGYMIGLFSFLYLTVVCVSREYSFTGYLKQAGKMLGIAVVAAGCCAFLLIPAFMNLKNGNNALWDIPVSFQFRYGLTDIFSKLVPGAYDTLTDSGLPNIYFSVFGAMMAAAYFLNGGIPVRERVAFGAFMGLLTVSMSCEIIDIAWHAFEDPTWFPARYSFLVAFLGLSLGLRGVEKHKNLTGGKIIAVAAILLVLFAETAIRQYYFMDMREISVGLFLVAAYALLIQRLFSQKRRAVAFVILGLLCAELWYNSYSVITGIDEQFLYKSRDGYTAYREEYSLALELLPEHDGEPYRTEIAQQRNANGGMALGYNSISHYSSTTNQAVNRLLYSLGNNKGTMNELRFSPGSPFASGLAGVKYVLSKGPLSGPYTYHGTTGVIDVYENQFVFPLAFFADYSAIKFDTEGTDPFELQNRWAWSIMPESTGDVFIPLDDANKSIVNAAYEERETGQRYYERIVKKETAFVEWEIENQSGDECYAYFSLYMNRFSRVKVFVNGIQDERILAYRSNAVIPLGKNEHITLRLELEGDSMNYDDVFFYRLDKEAAREISGYANENKATFEVFRDTKVEGTITAPRDGLMVTTFPYCKGWYVEVNGTKANCEQYAGVFAAIPVTTGVNSVVMRYSPPGFLPGVCVSVASLLAVLAVTIWNYRKRRKSGE